MASNIGFSYDKIHLLGIDWGAQVVGVAGEEHLVKLIDLARYNRSVLRPENMFARLTALDPITSCYKKLIFQYRLHMNNDTNTGREYLRVDSKLSRLSAQRVYAIHTSGYFLGNRVNHCE